MIDIQTIGTYLLNYSPKIVGALLVLIIGWIFAASLTGILVAVMKKQKIEKTLISFTKNLTSLLLKVLVIITAISMLGVQMASFIAVLGAMAFAVGLALQGSLSNFAGGVLIILFKPFKVGDFIIAQGEKGTVNHIEVFHTVLKTPDNKTVIVPNGSLANANIVNISTEKERRVDFTFGIGYEDDFEKAKKIILKILSTDKRIIRNDEIFVRVTELADSSVNITARAWVNSSDFWGVFVDTTETVKKTFDKNNISIPYPQMDIHMKK